jgi:hypothetical protein
MLISAKHLATVKAGLLDRCLPRLTDTGMKGVGGARIQSCDCLTGELCRNLGCDPFKSPANTIGNKVNEFIGELEEINRAAWCCRYPEEKQPAILTRLPRATAPSLPALLKLLRCIRYNCDAGEGSLDAGQALATLDNISAGEKRSHQSCMPAVVSVCCEVGCHHQALVSSPAKPVPVSHSTGQGDSRRSPP